VREGKRSAISASATRSTAGEATVCFFVRFIANQNNRDSKQDLESARGHDTKSLQGIQVGKTASHGFVAASTISGVTCFMQR
jgi:hypothetical protein